MNTTADNCPTRGIVPAAASSMEGEPARLLKRIGSTTYKVNVHFSNNAKETMETILRKMIEREAITNA